MSDLTARGIEAYKQGNIAGAHQLFVEALRENANDELAWLWISGTIASDKDKMICLENALRINPNNEVTRQALTRLQEKVKAEEQSSTPAAQEPIAEQAPAALSMTPASAPITTEETQTPTTEPTIKEAQQPDESTITPQATEEAATSAENTITPATVENESKASEEVIALPVEEEPASAASTGGPVVEAKSPPTEAVPSPLTAAEGTTAEEPASPAVAEETVSAEAVTVLPDDDTTAPAVEAAATSPSEEAVPPAVTVDQQEQPAVPEQQIPKPVETQASGTDIYNAVTATVPAASETTHNAPTEIMPVTPSPEVGAIAAEIPQPEQSTAPMEINQTAPAETEEIPVQASMPACPRCGLSDEVTKVNPRGAAGPPEAVAARLMPPSKPALNRSLGGGLSTLGILILIIGAIFVFGLAAFFILPPNFNFLYGILAIIIGAIPFLLIYYRLMTVRYARIQRDYESQLMRWNEQMVKWNQLYYCVRCDVVFNPEQGSSVAPDQMQTLLNA